MAKDSKNILSTGGIFRLSILLVIVAVYKDGRESGFTQLIDGTCERK